MSTELKKFIDAYASMTVAVYEPMILRWYSGLAMKTMASEVAQRMQQPASAEPQSVAAGTAMNADTSSLRVPLPTEAFMNELEDGLEESQVMRRSADLLALAGTESDMRSLSLPGYPDAVSLGEAIYPTGVIEVAQPNGGPKKTVVQVDTVPMFVNRSIATRPRDVDFSAARGKVLDAMLGALKAVVVDPNKFLYVELKEAMKTLAKAQPDLFLAEDFPVFIADELIEALSPIGMAHFYRQLYFNAEEGFGPIEEAFTIAPLETLEVVYENVRRQIHEEVIEIGYESVSESATEEKNLTELSDKVSSMVQRDTSAGITANASYGSIGVWQVSASATANMQTASQRGREETSRRLKELTKRASERITKTVAIKTRDVDELTTTNVTRRVIKNDLAVPVSYGLRRVYRRIRVKVQDLGERLVWQLYVSDPGIGLAGSKFVIYREGEPIAVPDLPPSTKPRPPGGTDTGTTSSNVGYDVAKKTFFVTISIPIGTDREIVALSIDSITDLEGGGKDDVAPSPRNTVQWDKKFEAGIFSVKVGIRKGDASSVSISYTYSWQPSKQTLTEWESERKQAADASAKATAEARARALIEEFERQKALITERSKIRSRPANDLRREERYEVMNRMISHLFARSQQLAAPVPLEIELFHRYFDIDGMFTYTHPSWWKPRYTPVATGFRRPPYEITSESEPAPMGSSLGWLIQLDGDTRRNEFLNSPWVRVCLPIRRRREREAIEWLAKHVEGAYGYDVTKSPLNELIEGIEKIRGNEDSLGPNGPDYVTVDSTVGAPGGALRPESVYPVVDEFSVTVPTDGFIYDALKTTG
jgi:hypothetical protein